MRSTVCAPGRLQRESLYFRSYYLILKGVLIPPKAPSASFWRQCGRAGGSEVVSLEGGPPARCAALISPDVLRSFAFWAHLVVEVVGVGVVVGGDEL